LGLLRGRNPRIIYNIKKDLHVSPTTLLEIGKEVAPLSRSVFFASGRGAGGEGVWSSTFWKKTMSKIFKTIGLIARQRQEDLSDTLQSLKNLLLERQLSVIVETETANYLPKSKLPISPREEIGKQCDLIIVVGGDGSLLNAARVAVDSRTPVLGINRGRLGFLTDIHPSELNSRIEEVLDGNYIEEKRFLLTATIKNKKKTIATDLALNDVVLTPGELAHMIEFAISIDDQFVCSQRADGLIVATPTGSTAYALSGGGPILHPHLDAIVLVPMFPHTLSARPIVISGTSTTKILIPESSETAPKLSCDGQARITLPPGCEIYIEKKAEQLRLIHPTDYSYFQTLRSKLHWSTKL
jgi:NAD+ kinase